MILKNNQRIDGCSDTVPIGSLNPYLGSTAPYGYLICEGQLVSKALYPELYSICGSIYGTETSTHFYLPDLRGKVIAGYKENDAIFGTLGGLAGELTHLHTNSAHTLTTDEIPSHNHAKKLSVYNTYGSGWYQIGYLGVGQGAPQQTTLNGNSDQNTGGGQAHEHGDTGSASSVQPTMALNWIVKAFQLMPNQSYVSTTQQTSDVNTYSCTYINNALAGVTSNAIVIDDEEPQTTSTQLWINPDEELSHVEQDPVVFTTTEQLTNKMWVDGKPLYQRTFVADLTLNSICTVANLTTLNYEFISFYDISFTKVQQDNNARYWFPVFYCNDTDFARVYVRGSDKTLLAQVKGTAVTELKVYATLLYTKAS